MYVFRASSSYLSAKVQDFFNSNNVVFAQKHKKQTYIISNITCLTLLLTTNATFEVESPCFIFYCKTKHPQHFLSLLLNNPLPHHHFLQQLHSQIITTSLFHHYPFHNNSTSLLLFNNLIRSYSLSYFPHQALQFFTHTLNNLTLKQPLYLNSFTLTFVSYACANLNTTHFGFHLHCIVFKTGFENHVFVKTGLLQMYSNWGFLVNSAQVFGEMPERNTVTWNVFISGLIKWGQLEFARSVFDRMLVRSVVSWTLIIDGYTRTNNKPLKAFALFRKMIEVDGIEPSEVTLLTVFPAIANLGNVKMCESVHGHVEKRGFNVVDIRIVNALIDLYAKFGCVESASRLFSEIPDWRKNSVSWNSVMSGYAIFGMVREAVETFENMEKAGVRPNHVAFLSILSACSHAGLVEEGLEFFFKMVNDYGLVPDVKHWLCDRYAWESREVRRS